LTRVDRRHVHTIPATKQTDVNVFIVIYAATVELRATTPV
jgi:hypothetical protein